MSTQHALILEGKQQPFVISKRLIPQAAPGELVVKVEAVALNPVDWKIQSSGFIVSSYPAVLGTDIAGDIEQVGEGVKRWEKGDRIFFQRFFPPDRGGFQQYTTIPADLVARVYYTYSQGTSILIALTAAVFGLFVLRPIGIALNPTIDSDIKQTGHAVLVLGGSTSVGQYAIQFLKYQEFNPIITYALSIRSEYLKALGGTYVINRRSDTLMDLPSVIERLFAPSDFQLKLVFDAVGTAEVQAAGLECLVEGGQLVTVNSTSEHVKNDREDGKMVLAMFRTVHLPHTREFGKVLYEKLPRLLEQDILIRFLQHNCVEDLPNGLEGIIEGEEKQKLVAHPQEPLS
ncbi:hypothetical protein GYMLUDRAFT_231149 [Collybiopsis luxurians FD-317 M1]|uniref:Enoyl reductase (ER) domain-containing protein n=1 Tax=Collybiopsis luxurians FD-317 M1 TaxID=944289 RepID=A0A0D0BKG1_9AGAR|nr:hypothetical protein GYMLUDRAFT_231149 [Collybiopsis luxurians FD-317 M1]